MYIHTTLYDPNADVVLDEYRRIYEFEHNKNSIKFMVSVCKQDLIDRCTSKSLEIHQEVKVYGSLTKFKRKMKAEEVEGGYLHYSESGPD